MTKPSKIFYNIEIYLTTGASFRCVECGKIYSNGVHQHQCHHQSGYVCMNCGMKCVTNKQHVDHLRLCPKNKDKKYDKTFNREVSRIEQKSRFLSTTEAAHRITGNRDIETNTPVIALACPPWWEQMRKLSADKTRETRRARNLPDDRFDWTKLMHWLYRTHPAVSRKRDRTELKNTGFLKFYNRRNDRIAHKSNNIHNNYSQQQHKIFVR